jgi:polysaccharide export outer membrane protein
MDFVFAACMVRNATKILSATTLAAMLASCSSIGTSGPSARAVSSAAHTNSTANFQFMVVDVDETAARRIVLAGRSTSLAEAIGDGKPFGDAASKGDVLDIVIWEAPPGALFGGAIGEPKFSSTNSGARGTSLPEQIVDSNGHITIPFAGKILAAGQTPGEIEREITKKLAGIAFKPQVMVRIVRNLSANVTVIGDVASSGRISLTPKGERILDILAVAGGVKQAVGKTMVRVTRGTTVAAVPLEQIISDPAQNIRLQPDDVLTALYQSYSFTALGAVGNNAEITFESTGVTLAQALGRIGGLRDDRADARSVFIFRLEDPSAVDPSLAATARVTPDGKIPVIYRINLRNPSSFFVAQSFPIQNQDVVYVSNTPVADFQKFVNIVSSLAFSAIGVTNVIP